MLTRTLLVLTLASTTAACTTTDDVGDPLGMPDGKEDGSWWKPERALDIQNAPFEVSSSNPGHAVRGHFNPGAYAGVVFNGVAGTSIFARTRSWLAEGERATWETEPFLFSWTGPTGGDVTDWDNWSLVSSCCNNRAYKLPRTSSYLLAVMTTEAAYAAGADFLAYVVASDAAATTTTVKGTIRCGAKRAPAKGVTLNVGDERVVSAADGSFEFAQSYPTGRVNIWASVSGASDQRYFDAVLAPDGGPVSLVLTTCQ